MLVHSIPQKPPQFSRHWVAELNAALSFYQIKQMKIVNFPEHESNPQRSHQTLCLCATTAAVLSILLKHSVCLF